IQAVAAIHTTNGRPTSPRTNAPSVRSPDSGLFWIALSRPNLSPTRLDSLFRPIDTGNPRGAPGRALRATTAASLGCTLAKTISGSQERMAFCLSMERAVARKRRLCGADEPNQKGLVHTPLSSRGVAFNPLTFAKHPGPIRTVELGDPECFKKDFFFLPHLGGGYVKRAGSISVLRKRRFCRRMLVIMAHRPWLVMTDVNAVIHMTI
ncbi:uncharacterized protein LY79DRAFT_689063, partial [Colletotrichum navitas]